MEKYAQARIGGNAPAETTGAWVVAKSSTTAAVRGRLRAPQLHTHTVIFNIAETADGVTRALQPQELYKTQQYATAVYRSELSARLQQLGYEIERANMDSRRSRVTRASIWRRRVRGVSKSPKTWQSKAAVGRRRRRSRRTRRARRSSI